MAVRLPPSNLNPAAQPWARRVELLLEELSNGQAGIRQNHATVTRSVGAVTRAVPSLAAQFATVTSRVAGAPSALTGIATGYFDSVTGNAEASVVLAWTAPSQYTDGTAMTPLLYEIHRMLPGGVWAFVTNVTDPSATLLRQPYAGGTVQYRVRAQGDNGGYSAWSDPATVVMPVTLTAPPAPAAPTLASNLGMVVATWDGKLGGGAPPAGVRGIYAETSTDSTTWTQGGQLMQASGGKQTSLGPFANGATVQVRLKAIDALGQSSAASSAASITVQGVAGLQASIDAANAAATAAQNTASGKGASYWQATAPTGGTYTSADIWFNTGFGYQPNRWNGTAWVSTPLGAAALSITDPSNLFENPKLTASPADANTPLGVGTVAAANGGYSSGNFYLAAKSGSSNGATATAIFPVMASGETVRVEADLWLANTVGTAFAGIAINYYDANKALLGSTLVAYLTPQTAGATVRSRWSGTYTLPSTAIWFTLRFIFNDNAETTNRIYFGNVMLRRQVTSGLIANGAIGTTQLAQSVNDSITLGTGKNKITSSTAAASGSGVVTGDLWNQVNAAGNVIAAWRWSGTAWVAQNLDPVYIPALDASKITTGYLAAALIQAGSLDASVLTARTITADRIGTNAITATEIATGTITADSGIIGSLDAGVITAGTLNTARLAANSIDGAKISAGTIGADRIAANSLTAAQIKAGTITATEIVSTGLTGITVTGGTLQTSATAARGVKLTGTGLQAFDASGVATFTVDGTTGAVVANTLTATGATISGSITATGGSITGTLNVTGQIQTGTSGARLIINSSGIGGYNSSNVQTFSFLTTNGSLRATSAVLTDMQVLGNSSFGGTMTVNGTFQTSANAQRVVLDSNGLHGYNSSGTEVFSFLEANGSMRATGGTFTSITVTGSSTFSGSLSGATGSFSGSLSGATGTFAGNLTAATGTITGTMTVSGQLRTATSGQRVTMDPGGLTAYTSSGDSLNLQGQFLSHTNAAGSITNSQLQFSDGALYLTYFNGTRSADFTLSDDGQPRVSSNAILNRQYSQAIQMATPDSTHFAPVVVTDQGTLGTSTGSQWSMAQQTTYPRWQSDSGGVSWIQASGFYTQLWSRDSTHVGMRVIAGGTNRLYVDASSGGTGLVRAQSDLEVGGQSGNSYLLFSNDGSTSTNPNLVQSMTIANRQYPTVSKTAGTSQKIVVITPSGTLGILTGAIGTDYAPGSLRGLKHDIVDWDGELEKLLSLRPVKFRYNEGYLEDGGREHVGFIAEEVVEAGLEILTSTGAEGELQGVEYGNMTAGLLALAQRQEQQIAALERRMVEAGI